jgi:glycosyltransferase involved in cell wall biosynthesis
MMRQPIKNDNLPKPAHAFVLVCTNVPHKLLYAWLLLQRGYTVVPYFMDDWMANNNLRWKGGNLQQVVKDLLAAAPAWLMISEALKNTLIKRYKLAPKPCLVVHNPSPTVEFAVGGLQFAGRPDEHSAFKLPTGNRESTESQPTSGGDTVAITPLVVAAAKQASPCRLPTANCQLIYAGSIWPMHADALVAVAQAIQLLQAQGNTKFALHIYTSEAHWTQYGSKLQGPGVQYMGWKPYAELPPVLNKGWLLLCAASFAEDYAPYSLSSVQTKLTDYMAAGKPILFVGPADGASGNFVETWDCGFTMGNANPADIAEGLQAITRMPAQYARKAHNGLREATTTFSKAAVQQRLYAFLAQVPLPTEKS